MRIALLTDGIYPHVMGGMQKHSFYLAKYFAMNKVHVDLYHPSVPDAKFFLNAFSPSEVNFIHPRFVEAPPTRYFPGHYIYESFRYSQNLSRKLVADSGVDFVYAQGFTGWELIRQKKNGTPFPAPVGVNFHGLNMFQKSFGWRNLFNNLLFRPFVSYNLRNADLIFSLGRKFSVLIREKISGAPPIIEIPVGIDEGWLIGESEIRNSAVISFVFIGRYDRVKGIDLVNSVIHDMLGCGLVFEFHFIGPFPERVKIEHEQVIYHGELKTADEVRAVLRTCDVVVSSSYSEGMPTVIIEGMASGLAVLATDVGVVDELVDSSNGLLVRPGDERSLGAAMRRFVEMDRALLTEMKRSSLQKASGRFVWGRIIEKTSSAIREFIRR